MILADTSIWVDYLRTGDEAFANALARSDVATHRWIVGELALGGTSTDVLALLDRLPHVTVADDSEVLRLIAAADLSNTGIGWVDAHLLASTRLSPGTRLLTADRKLAAQAARLGIASDLRN